MADRFQNISFQEMKEFLEPQGFKLMDLKDGTVELVWGKIVKKDGVPYSLRVYTTINPDGMSRDKGKDAIRFMLFVRYNGDVRKVGETRKCLRVKNWRQNLQTAIDQWQDSMPMCSACGAPQVQRTRRKDNVKFWACLTFFQTGCNGRGNREHFSQLTKQANPVKQANPTFVKPTQSVKSNSYRIPDNMLSDAQRAFEDAFVNGEKHIVGGARAGAGKTTMLKHTATCRKNNEKWVYLAFGRKNASEGREKMPRFVKSQTTHGFCSGILRQSKIELPEKPSKLKTQTILDNLYPSMDSKVRKRIRKATHKMVGLAKNFACKPGDHESIKNVFDQYTFDLGDDSENSDEQQEINTVLELTSEILKLSLPGEKYGSMYDFDDMLWYVVMLNLNVPNVDVVLADEVQDFNACQIWLLRKLASKGTRIVAVGDPYQAVFRFRGADCDAYDKVSMALADTERGMQECILPTNYRCGKNIIEYVRESTHVNDIEAAPNAIDGEVTVMSYDDILDLLTDEALANSP